MTATASIQGSATSAGRQSRTERRPTPGASSCSTGLGGNAVAHIVEENCPGMLASAGVVIEHLDAQAGAWQFSTDDGQTWRAIRTDLVNRPGNMGLALDRDARLRVLPFGGHRVNGVRVAFHTVQRSHAQGNGSYRAYAADDREDGSRTVTLVLGLAAINGTPPAVHVPRPRNKRAMVQRAAAAAAAASSSSSSSLAAAMAMA